MKIIETFEELVSLPIDSSILIINQGNYQGYFLCGYSEKMGAVALVSNSNTAIKVTKHNFKNAVYALNYNSNMVGQIMIDQLNKEIEKVRLAYLDNKEIMIQY